MGSPRIALLALLLGACGRVDPIGPPPCPESADVASDARALASALARGELPRCFLPQRTTPRVEIQQKLTETDEREVGRGLASILADRTRWPFGVVVRELAACFGDCCDFRLGGLEPGRLYLRRLCFASREDARRRASLITFAEAR